MYPTSPVSTHITPQTQSEITATNETQVSEVALNALRVLSLLLLAAGVGCLIAGLVPPAVSCLVAGAALIIFLVRCADEALPCREEIETSNGFLPPRPNPSNTTSHPPAPINNEIPPPIPVEIPVVAVQLNPVVEQTLAPQLTLPSTPTFLPLNLTGSQESVLREFMKYWKDLLHSDKNFMTPQAGYRHTVNGVMYASRYSDSAMIVQKDVYHGNKGLRIPDDLSPITLSADIPIYQCLAKMAHELVSLAKDCAFCLKDRGYYANSKALAIQFVDALEEFAKTGNLDAPVGDHTIREVFQGAITPPNMDLMQAHPSREKWLKQFPRPPLPKADLQGGLQQTLQLLNQDPTAGANRMSFKDIKIVLPIVELILQSENANAGKNQTSPETDSSGSLGISPVAVQTDQIPLVDPYSELIQAREALLTWFDKEGSKLGQGDYDTLIAKINTLSKDLPKKKITLHFDSFRWGFSLVYLEKTEEKKSMPITELERIILNWQVKNTPDVALPLKDPQDNSYFIPDITRKEVDGTHTGSEHVGSYLYHLVGEASWSLSSRHILEGLTSYAKQMKIELGDDKYKTLKLMIPSYPDL